MLKKLKQERGFTIIEVLIVLAIAGLIMLIVFLAVPALQRNSRNTQRKEDAAKLLAAVTEWSNNNNGTMPTGIDVVYAVTNAKLSIYNGAIDALTTWPTDTESINIAVNNKCDGETAITAQNRSVAVLYNVETGTGSAQQCDES